ncbi:MAG TPA: hypothetical protein VFN61_10095 [Acidimicrobiales bacterium]|nr:hypothetical protein [Acidimicrobiales bacterium]
MSRTVDLFVDSDQPLEQVADLIGDLAGQPLVRVPDGPRFVFDDGQVTAQLSEHDFVDDEDLPLSEFRYVLSSVVRGALPIDKSPELLFLRRLNNGLHENSVLPSLLVVDLERPDDDPFAPWGGGPSFPDPCHPEDDDEPPFDMRGSAL